MNMIKTGKIGMGMALAALALTAGCASMTDGESLGVAEEAIVSVPAGTRLSCSMSSPSFTGRRQAYLVVGDDLSTCYREAIPGDVPASLFVASCHKVGYSIGCDRIVNL